MPTSVCSRSRSLAAFAAVSLELERIYSVIFGSQIRILEELNTQGPMRLEQLRPTYNEAMPQWGVDASAFPFEQYLGYLTGRELLEVQGATARITPKGRAFLAYLAQEGKARRAG